MRALLVVNPRATSSSVRVRDVIAHALAAECKVDVVETTRRGHAMDLADQAIEDRFGLVVVHGGDGTVNEAVNGMLRAAGRRSAAGEEPRPALAVVPGGSTNVFARVAGYPADPVEATGAVLDALRSGERRTVGLGAASTPGQPERYFTFCAGVGFDAEVVRLMEERRAGGYRPTHARYVRAALAHYLRRTDRRRAALRLHRPGLEPVDGLHLAIVANTSPWTFWNGHPVRPTPRASFDTGLDLLAVADFRLLATTRTCWQLLRPPRGGISAASAVSLHDLPELELEAAVPVAWQVDGDYLGEAAGIRLRAVPRALDLLGAA